MKQLSVRFTEEAKENLSRTSQDVDHSVSSVARAALNIGLTIIAVESLKEGGDVSGMIKNCQGQ